MRSLNVLIAATLTAFYAVANAGIGAKAPLSAAISDANALHAIWPQRVSGQHLLLTASHQGATLALFVVRFDSKATGDGLCGAGSEDYLVLARMGKTVVRPLAAERIQSCLDAQSLLIDDGDDFDALVRHLQPDPARCAVSFQPLTDDQNPQRVSVHIDAAQRKLIRDMQPSEGRQATCAAAPPATRAAPRAPNAHI